MVTILLLFLVLAALALWCLLGLALALLIGSAVRLRDQHGPEQREDQWAA